VSQNQVPSNNGGPRTYVDPEGVFSINAPKGWAVDNSGQQGTRVVLFQPTREGEFRPNVVVVVQRLVPLTREEYIILCRLQAKQLSGSAQLKVDEPAREQPATQAAHVFEWSSLQMSPVGLRFRQLILFRSDRVFTLTATATIQQFESYRDRFESTLSSFRLLDDSW
jgi:hypothetical protein